jgi:enoyl-CoA hydratase/carnithine racemase
MPYEQISYAVDERVATITLNRPQARNAYTIQMADELADAFGRADSDVAVRVVLLTGAGVDFCVGADLSAGSLDLPTDASPWVEPASRVVRPMFHLAKPIVAAVRGAAVGVGSTMLLAADVRFAATDTRFGFVFGRRGLYPEGGSAWFLPRLVGLGRAMEWMISGRLVSAAEALAAGLVAATHEPDDVVEAALGFAREIAAKTAPVSTAVTRQALYRMSALDSPEPAFELDSRLIASCATSADAVEGIVSFLEHRTPQFTGVVPKDLPGFLPWSPS